MTSFALSTREYPHVLQIHQVAAHVGIEPQQLLTAEDPHGARRGFGDFASCSPDNPSSHSRARSISGSANPALSNSEFQDGSIRPRLRRRRSCNSRTDK